MNHLPPLQNIHTLANNSYNTNFDKQNRLFTEMFSNLVQQDRAISLEAWQNLPELQQSYKTFDLFADANKTRQLIDFDNVEQMQAVFDGRYKKYVNFVGGADAETLPNFINREIEYFNKWVLQSFISEYPKINIVKNHLQKYIAFVEAKLQPLAGGAPSMIKQLGINNIMNLYATSVKPPIKYDFELEMKTIFDKRYNVEITENDLLTNGFSNVAINRFFKGIVSYDDKLKLIKFIENRHKKPSPIITDNNTPPIENTARAKKPKAVTPPIPFEKLFVKDGIGAKGALDLLNDYTNCLDENNKWIDGKNQTDIITWIEVLKFKHQIKDSHTNVDIAKSLNYFFNSKLRPQTLSNPKNNKLFNSMKVAIN
jgi:hypothetical protein